MTDEMNKELRALIANLAAVVRVQNGNRHADTNALLDHANRMLSELSVMSALEQPAAPAQPVAAQPALPVAWARKWYIDGENPEKEKKENGRWAWPAKFKLLPLTPNKLCKDDVALGPIAAPPAQQESKDADRYLNEQDFADLFRFNECCEDPGADGHDVPKERMRRLEELGAVRSRGFGRHELTAFGSYVIETVFLQNPSLPLKTTEEHNAAIAASIQAKGDKS